VSKLQLVRRPLWAATDAQALGMIRQLPKDSDAVVLEGAGAASPAPPTAEALGGGEVEVLHFSANRLKVKATVPPGGPAWLVYADTYHKGWRCLVNGKQEPVLVANFALKAVRLPPGESEVRFVFGEWPRVLKTYLITLLNIAFASLVLFGVLRRSLLGGGAPLIHIAAASPGERSPRGRCLNGPHQQEELLAG
jgi:hypothetical protein